MDGEELLKGEREANQVYGSLALIRSLSKETSNWQISPYHELMAHILSLIIIVK